MRHASVSSPASKESRVSRHRLGPLNLAFALALVVFQGETPPLARTLAASFSASPALAADADPEPSELYLPLVLRDVLGTPSLISPADGGVAARLGFDWTDVEAATGYQFQLATMADFASPTVDQNLGSSDYSMTSSLTGTYYWRVRALGPGDPGAYSETRSLQLVDYYGDDDGDSLPNGWELHGYDPNDDGTPEVDLPALGADYRHKDIFVEMDYMYRASATNGLGPDQAVLDGITSSFNNAPVSNPDGITGIHIHLDLDDQVPYDQNLSPVFTQFFALKSTHFDTNRLATHRYMIWADQYNGGTSSGIADGIPATDFLVTLGSWHSGAGGTDGEKIGTFIHELGHTLGLRHGGSDDINYKPNYLSVMSYTYQTIGVIKNNSFYHFDYQRFNLPNLDETNLSEPNGLNASGTLAGYGVVWECPGGYLVYTLNGSGAIDWNCDGDSTDSGFAQDTNTDGYTSTLTSYNDWPNLDFDGGGVIGSGLAPEALRAQIEANFVDPKLNELTEEQMLQIQPQIGPPPGP
jgi:hypothetical protein